MVSGMDTMETSNNSSNTNANSVPSPQSVGREFVRQYYTILNKGPQLLHRFYSEDSSYVHGGVDRPGEVSNPVYGQDNINKKIMALNFKDCHAKIRQVDSMETIDKGVVIQVTGELSNNGEPMRRFLQTFVLAPQSAVKYYVRNDIFRYQDEIFLDDEDYSEVDKSDVSLEKNDVPALKSVDEKEDPISAVATDFYENTNGTIHESIISGTDKLSLNNEVTEEKTPELDTTDVFEEEAFAKNEEFAERGSTSPQPQTNELKTYANMVSKNPNANFPPFAAMSSYTSTVKATENAGSLTAPFARPVEMSPIPPMSSNSGTSYIQQPSVSSVAGKPPSNTTNAGQQRENRTGRRNQQYSRRNESREMTPGRGPLNDSDSADGDYQSKRQYPDENQVFVGNLPQNIIEDDLRNLFARYGRILDVRINRQNQKLGSNVKTPNYGFVTFESSEIVQQILKQKPIYFDNHRFNVEEKRSQQGRGSQNFDRNLNRGGSGGGMGGRLNNSMGNISGNRSQSGGSSGNPRNRGNQQFSSGGGSRGAGGGSGSGGGGFGPNRNSSFSNRQNR